MARMVATKAALSIRVDALSDADSRSDVSAAEVGISNRVKLESRLRALEHQAGIQSVRKVVSANGQQGRQQPRFEMSGVTGSYNAATDNVPLNGDLLPTQPATEEVKEEKDEKKDKKKKRKSEVAEAGDVTMDGDADLSMVAGETKEERRARKEAKKAVSSLHPSFRPTLILHRPRLRRKLPRSLAMAIRSPRRDEQTRMKTARRRKRRRRRTSKYLDRSPSFFSVVFICSFPFYFGVFR